MGDDRLQIYASRQKANLETTKKNLTNSIMVVKEAIKKNSEYDKLLLKNLGENAEVIKIHKNAYDLLFKIHSEVLKLHTLLSKAASTGKALSQYLYQSGQVNKANTRSNLTIVKTMLATHETELNAIKTLYGTIETDLTDFNDRVKDKALDPDQKKNMRSVLSKQSNELMKRASDTYQILNSHLSLAKSQINDMTTALS